MVEPPPSYNVAWQYQQADVQSSEAQADAFAASMPRGVHLYLQLLHQLMHDNDWGNHVWYNQQVMEDHENTITNMNIPPVELLKQVQGGDVYSQNMPLQTYV